MQAVYVASESMHFTAVLASCCHVASSKRTVFGEERILVVHSEQEERRWERMENNDFKQEGYLRSGGLSALILDAISN